MEFMPQNKNLENKTEDAEAILRLMKNFNYKFNSEEEKEILKDKMTKWIGTLFNTARNSKGGKKLEYATAIRTIELSIGREMYLSILEILMTNSEAVDDLSDQAVSEMNPVNKIRKFLGFKE